MARFGPLRAAPTSDAVIRSPVTDIPVASLTGQFDERLNEQFKPFMAQATAEGWRGIPVKQVTLETIGRRAATLWRDAVLDSRRRHAECVAARDHFDRLIEVDLKLIDDRAGVDSAPNETDTATNTVSWNELGRPT